MVENQEGIETPVTNYLVPTHLSAEYLKLESEEYLDLRVQPNIRLLDKNVRILVMYYSNDNNEITVCIYAMRELLVM